MRESLCVFEMKAPFRGNSKRFTFEDKIFDPTHFYNITSGRSSEENPENLFQETQGQQKLLVERSSAQVNVENSNAMKYWRETLKNYDHVSSFARAYVERVQHLYTVSC